MIKNTFCVIGKEGSTEDGEGFVQRLWQDANSHFDEVKDLAVYEDGTLNGIRGVMSDFSMRFMPWEEGFSKGLYLAGVEVTSSDTFMNTITMMKHDGIDLAGAVQDHMDPKSGKNDMLFP